MSIAVDAIEFGGIELILARQVVHEQHLEALAGLVVAE